MSNRDNVGTPAPAVIHTSNLAVFIGRFQPTHNGHLAVIVRALTRSDALLILVGSSGKARDTFNPFTFDERKAMLLSSIDPSLHERIRICPIFDYENNTAWVKSVQDEVRDALEFFTMDEIAHVALIGHSKDKTSFYLKLFPQWASVEVPNYKGISATPIRDEYFAATRRRDLIEYLPAPVLAFLDSFYLSEAYRDLVEEFEFNIVCKLPYKDLKWPPIFMTVDACVVQSGHVLLIKRRARPGKGLWALPGGYVNADERIIDAVFRELREETKIRVPEDILRGSVKAQRIFDGVNRSARGRIITNCFRIDLANGPSFPKVKGSDDALTAKWWPLTTIRRDMCFEDHYNMIQEITGVKLN